MFCQVVLRARLPGILNVGREKLVETYSIYAHKEFGNTHDVVSINLKDVKVLY